MYFDNKRGFYISRRELCTRYRIKALQNFKPASGYTDIAVATGRDYPDALAGAVFAAKHNLPLILVNRDRVDSTVADFLKTQNLNKAYIFGGPEVVQYLNAISEAKF